MNDLIENIDKLHTTTKGIERIKRNLNLEIQDVVEWCKEQILNKEAKIEQLGKNWYITINNDKITVNARSYTIITAHKRNKNL